jgi:glycosyltransferase involved in cell wall biosynthesis
MKRNCENAPGLNVELVLVNDSPDFPICGIPELCNDMELIVSSNEKNSGIHASRINGLLKSRGKNIVFLDQDDDIADNALASQYQVLEGGEAVVSNGFVQNAAGSRKLIYRSHRAQSYVNDLPFYFYAYNQIVSPGMCMIARQSIPEPWIRNIQQINGSDDLLLWCLFLSEGHRFSLNPETLYTHVETGENASGNERGMLGSLEETISILKSNSKIPPDLLDALRRQVAVQIRTIGKGPLKRAISYVMHGDFDLVYHKLLSR